MKNEERDVYIIPPNFIEGGTLMGGMLKTRNAIEAAILGTVVGWPVLHFRSRLASSSYASRRCRWCCSP